MNRIPVCAVIPAYNAETSLGNVIDRTREHVHRVIVVNDGSTDSTEDVARGRGVEVVSLSSNKGKGYALRRGFSQALTNGCRAVVTLDADGQHDPAEIPRFLAAWRTERRPDLIVGRRDFREMPLVRRLSNVLGGRAFSWAVGREIPDNQSGYRLVSRRLAEATLASDEPGFAFEVEQITTCIRMGGSIAWVPVRTIYAGAPSHIRPLAHLREFVRIVRRARHDVRTPLG